MAMLSRPSGVTWLIQPRPSGEDAGTTIMSPPQGRPHGRRTLVPARSINNHGATLPTFTQIVKPKPQPTNPMRTLQHLQSSFARIVTGAVRSEERRVGKE